jgi:hypothetical protein
MLSSQNFDAKGLPGPLCKHLVGLKESFIQDLLNVKDSGQGASKMAPVWRSFFRRIFPDEPDGEEEKRKREQEKNYWNTNKRYRDPEGLVRRQGEPGWRRMDPETQLCYWCNPDRSINMAKPVWLCNSKGEYRLDKRGNQVQMKAKSATWHLLPRVVGDAFVFRLLKENKICASATDEFFP